MAIEALAKQIPKQVMNLDTNYPKCCPDCGWLVTKGYEKHCADCGQKLDWEDE